MALMANVGDPTTSSQQTILWYCPSFTGTIIPVFKTPLADPKISTLIIILVFICSHMGRHSSEVSWGPAGLGSWRWLGETTTRS